VALLDGGHPLLVQAQPLCPVLALCLVRLLVLLLRAFLLRALPVGAVARRLDEHAVGDVHVVQVVVLPVLLRRNVVARMPHLGGGGAVVVGGGVVCGGRGWWG
jgi:hypothetical protein